ncbi:hypothetical protein EVAR_11958_1 [Eumeta japonica]|uniref:Uncharacterized protein n=1 Tax=Eumeta variegata TaxID=151549 RepID=A0A4C1U4Y2_EUMVA|nr:hypothetical protein EVAR_11958_1 [Eumeta japonica]
MQILHVIQAFGHGDRDESSVRHRVHVLLRKAPGFGSVEEIWSQIKYSQMVTRRRRTARGGEVSESAERRLPHPRRRPPAPLRRYTTTIKYRPAAAARRHQTSELRRHGYTTASRIG